MCSLALENTIAYQVQEGCLIFLLRCQPYHYDELQPSQLHTFPFPRQRQGICFLSIGMSSMVSKQFFRYQLNQPLFRPGFYFIQSYIVRNSQKQLEIVRNSQKQPEIARNSQKQQKIAQNSQKQPEIARNGQKQQQFIASSITDVTQLLFYHKLSSKSLRV